MQPTAQQTVDLTRLSLTALSQWASNINLPPTLQQAGTHFFASAASAVLPPETKQVSQVSFDPHPLHTLCHLLERGHQGAPLGTTLYSIPEGLRNAVFHEVWALATDPLKGGAKWGELHALENPFRLAQAVNAVVIKKLHALPQEKKCVVFGTIYRMARQPATQDLQWGEHNATADLKRLIRALHRTQNLDIPGKEILVIDLEKNSKNPSHLYHLNRPELDQGQIGFHNGMQNSKESALKRALYISDHCAQGRNLHCTYSATVNLSVDAISALLGQGEAITPPVVHLLEQWLDFFENNEDVKLLQICHSRGAIEVYNALNKLPPSLQQRINVITIAPACFIPPSIAFQVINLIIETDLVVKIAANQELLNTDCVLKLNPHNDTSDPHDMRGSSYKEKLASLVDCYIRTNRIF